MKRTVRLVGIAVALPVAIAAGVLGLAWWNWERAAARVYEIDDPPLPAVDADALAHGRYLYRTRGCMDCHGENGEGTWVLEVSPLGRLVAPNITAGGRGAGYTADDLARAIRHGVRPDGTPLLAMPVGDYAEMGDADTAALAAHVLSLPPAVHEPGTSEIHLPGRVLHLFGRLPAIPAEHLDHAPRVRAVPTLAPTVDYGAYAANTCKGCHGDDHAGKTLPGKGPEAPVASNLTLLASKGWQEADFIRLMREGKRPDGSDVSPVMPWRSLSQTSDIELKAMWAHFSSLPPKTPQG